MSSAGRSRTRTEDAVGRIKAQRSICRSGNMHNQAVADRPSPRATDVFIVTCRGDDSINITRYVLLLGSDVYVCYRNSLTHSGHKRSRLRDIRNE